MTAPPGPPPHPPPPPRPLDHLRKLATAKLDNIKPEEFQIKHWIAAAREAFTAADRQLAQAGHPWANPRLAEEAYIEYRKAGQIMDKIAKHPAYAGLKAANPPEYFSYQSLRPLILDSAKKQQELTRLIEQRYADYERTRPPPSAPSSQPSPQPPSMQQDISINTLIDGYAVDSPPTSPDNNPKPAQPHSPVDSITDRLKALRSPSHSSSPLPPATRPPPSASKPPPPIPTKPNALSAHKTPPGSPQPRHHDLAALDSRSGSAPPAIPLAGAGAKDTMGLGLGGPAEYGLKEQGQNGWGHEQQQPQHASRQELASTASAFGAQFPSVDDLDNVDWLASARQSATSLPSVPTGLPGPSNGRPLSGASQASSSQSQGRPVEFNAADFEREKFQREEAMAKLQGSPPARQPNGLPPGAAPPSQGRTPAAVGPTTRGPLPLAPPKEKGGHHMPITDNVLPGALWQYLSQQVAKEGKGPRVLLLDVRPKEEYDRGCVKGEVVCLEPAAIRPGITSQALEDGLSMSPRLEQERFKVRHLYDLVVVYDRSSSDFPKSAPPDHSTSAQQALYHLYKAIYESEFRKNLNRPPVILIGGWEAWEKKVGEEGIVRANPATFSPTATRGPVDEFGQLETKKQQNRKAAVVGGQTDGPVFKTGSTHVPEGGQYGAPVSQFGAGASGMSSGYFGAQPGAGQGRYPGVLSPSVAMPPTAAQRPGSAVAYEPFSPVTSPQPHPSDFTNRPAYPQPHIPNYYQPPSAPSPQISGSQPNGMTRTNGFSDFQQLGPSSQQSFSPRPSIDYPNLRKAPAPPVGVAPYSSSQPSRPPPPMVAPARPAPAAPAPLRSNSSFSLSLNGYNPAYSRSPIGLSFGDEAIGLTGLKNLGNTCYMNSTVQCLSATIPFAKFFKDGAFRAEINTANPLGTKGALAKAVAELITALWMNNYLFLSPVTFRENICRFAEQFRGSDQHDAQEFLGFLLDGLHEDLNRIKVKPPPIEMGPEREHDLETLPAQVMSEREWRIYRRRDDSFVVDCFQGQFRNQLRCLTCGQTSTTYNTFMPLSVPVPAGRNLRVSVLNCIDAFVREEIMEKDEAWFCPKCKTKRKASKKLSLSRLPPILVIHLKRFSFKGPFSDKIETQVELPLHGLDLTNYVPPPLMSQDGARPKQPPKGWVYDLYAVTNHYGNLSSGHYTAYVRSQSSWHHIGDSKVTAIDPSVLQTPQAAKSAYVLYLRLR